jgi:shikimate dehydrogenase
LLSDHGETPLRPPTRLGVLGWPITHSLSPAIQNAALRAAELTAWRYQLLPAPPDVFDELVHALAGAGFRGANVTLPHKSAALALATDPTPRARAIGAANTLVFEAGGSIVADNTDAPAVTASVPIKLTGATALVLGAGGSARAAVWALRHAGAAEVRVWNRTPERARTLCGELGGTPVTAVAPADVLVNCTSVGLDGSGSLDGLPLTAGQVAGFRCVVDLVYAARPTGLICAAGELGVPASDGLECLIGQGALSFELFTGIPASLSAMRAAVGRTGSAAVSG